jgi:hypothetical protein
MDCGVKRNNNNIVLSLADVRTYRLLGLRQTQTNQINVSDKQRNCTVQ